MHLKIGLLLIVFLISLKKKSIEKLFNRDGYITQTSCCGGLHPNEFDENSNYPPFKIHRCMKNYDYYKPCPVKGNRTIFSKEDKSNRPGWKRDRNRGRWYSTEGQCCGGRDTCIPTSGGGKCRMRSGRGYYIYDKDGTRKTFDPENEINVSETDYNYNQGSSNLFVYFNYIIILVITLFIIYYFQKIFMSSTSSYVNLSEYDTDYGYMGDIK